MKSKNLLLVSAAIISLNLFAQEAGDPVVATVDGVQIKKSQLDQAFNQNMMFVSDKTVSREKVLYDIINREIGIKKAKAAKLDQDPIVKAKMEDVLYHAQISKDLETRLQKIEVSDKEAEQYYNKHKEYRTAHILFRTRAVPDKVEAEEALKKANEVYASLKKNSNLWGELAAKYSQSSTAPSAGDMGFQPAIRMAPEYFAAINGKPNDFISAPVKTQFGYHIIKVLGVREWKEVDAGLYKKIVYDQKRDDVLDDYFASLRKSASIKIEKQYLK